MASIIAQSVNEEIIVVESDDQDISVEVLVPGPVLVAEVLVPGQVGYSSERIDVGARGSLFPVPGKHKYYVQGGGQWEFDSMVISVDTPPTGSPIKVDVNVNGSSIYADQANRPTILPGNGFATGGIPDTMVYNSGDYFTFDLDEVGSSVPGADLTLSFRLRKVA